MGKKIRSNGNSLHILFCRDKHGSRNTDREVIIIFKRTVHEGFCKLKLPKRVDAEYLFIRHSMDHFDFFWITIEASKSKDQ
jgi:hypothetical protein